MSAGVRSLHDCFELRVYVGGKKMFKKRNGTPGTKVEEPCDCHPQEPARLSVTEEEAGWFLQLLYRQE